MLLFQHQIKDHKIVFAYAKADDGTNPNIETQ